MSSTAQEEALACLACAGRQEIGADFTRGDLLQLMIQGKKSKTQENPIHPKNSEVWKNVVIDRLEGELQQWGLENNAHPNKDLIKWLDSSVAIANSLFTDSKSTLKSSKTYKFLHFDTIKKSPNLGVNFKEVFVRILSKIQVAAKAPNAKEFFDGATAAIYSDSEFKFNDDKWNPADMYAVDVSKEQQWNSNIKDFDTDRPISHSASKPWNSSSRSSLTGDLENFAGEVRSGKYPGNLKARIEIVLGMQDVYAYNKMINYGMKKGEFVPISLKLSTESNPAVDYSSVTEPKDVLKYFQMKVTPLKWSYRAENQNAECFFKMEGVPGSNGEWNYTIRQSQSSEKWLDNMTNFKLTKPEGGGKGASAFAGSAALSIVTKISRMSGGRAAFAQLNRKRTELWKKYTPPGMKNPTKGVFYSHTASKIHGLTNYKVFDTLHKVHTKQMKDAAKNELKRDQVGFDRRISEAGTLAQAKKSKILNEDPTGVLNDIKMWAEYAEWLSESGDIKTTQRGFLKQALGNSQFNETVKRERSRLAKKGPYNITLSSVQANYMKRKIQAYEVAWLIDHASTSNPLTVEMRNNILKSIWLYAASKGFMIFRKNNVKAYLLSGPYLKCAA